MSNLSQFTGGNRPPTQIVNCCSAGGVNLGVISSSYPSKPYASGDLTAGVWKEVLAVSGSGVLKHASATSSNTTSRTIGLKVVMDGVTVFEADTNEVTAVGWGILAVGGISTTNWTEAEALPFNVSLSVLIRSSNTETGTINAQILHHLT